MQVPFPLHSALATLAIVSRDSMMFRKDVALSQFCLHIVPEEQKGYLSKRAVQVAGFANYFKINGVRIYVANDNVKMLHFLSGYCQ